MTEGTDVVVGRADTGTYAVLPDDGAALLRRLSAGVSRDEAAAWYEHCYGEPVDVDDFVATLHELGFLRAAGSTAAAPAPLGPPRFQRLARALFSAPAWLLYAALVAAAAIALARHPDLRPASSHVYFTGSLTTVTLVLIFGQLPLAALHESYHVLAGQRLGLHSSLGVSNRYNYVVFETRTNGLYSVPRRRRYLPFLAGMVVDVVAFAALALLAAALRTPGGTIPLAGRVCLALSFAVAARLGWQLLLHLRTDLYYVLSTALNCYDLHEASKAIFANRIRRRTGRLRAGRPSPRLVDETQWTDRDRRIGAWYGWLIAVGFTATIGLAVFVTGPVAVTFVARTVSGVATGAGTWHFWDSLVSLVVFTVQIALPATLALRKRRHRSGRKPKLVNA
ncbi:PqqD family protein [Catenulispora yoronensis]|uniref:PqqD family protein n=1 Tax=Catenulispora yoronensis TaxID=450799 RepID=UPI0031DF7E3E